MLGCQAAYVHLSLACMRHISALLQPTASQQAPANSMLRLAHAIATSTAMAAQLTDNDFTEKGPRVLMGQCPHFAAWSDVLLLLGTYAHILQHGGQLPAVKGMARSATISGTDAAAAAAGGSSSRRRSGSSSSRSSRQQQQQQQQGLTLVPNWGATDHLALAQAALRDVQGQWDRIPDSHKQLLQLLGVSPQVAVWLAGIMIKQHVPLPEPLDCWAWNSHNVATDASQQHEGPSGSRASSLSGSSSPGQLQLLLLLNGVNYGTQSDHDLPWSCCRVFHATQEFVRQRLPTAAQSQQQQQTGGASERTINPILAPMVQSELLLLTLESLQRLQQLQTSASSVSSPPPPTARTTRTFTTVAGWLECIAHAHIGAAGALVFLAHDVERGAQSAAAAAAGAAAAGAAAGVEDSCTGVPEVFMQRAVDLFGAFECSIRAAGFVAVDGDHHQLAAEVATLCINQRDQSNLLLVLAQRGAYEQQAAFSNLLVTLLKLSGTAASSGLSSTGSRCRAVTISSAVQLLVHCSRGSGATLAPPIADDTAINSSSSCNAPSHSGTSAALWLLLSGRCYLLWAAELAQMQAEGADWVQVISSVQQQQQPWVEAVEKGVRDAVCCCFSSSSPPLLIFVHMAMGALVQEGGVSIIEGLLAAGYDMEALMQAVDAIDACYPSVASAEGPSDVVASRVAGLIKAMEAAGRACSVFAVPHCCNNPGCSNLAGASEQSIVSGKGCICGGCKVARYCGKGCQKAHWKQHKPVCKMLQAVMV